MYMTLCNILVFSVGSPNMHRVPVLNSELPPMPNAAAAIVVAPAPAHAIVVSPAVSHAIVVAHAYALRNLGPEFDIESMIDNPTQLPFGTSDEELDARRYAPNYDDLRRPRMSQAGPVIWDLTTIGFFLDVLWDRTQDPDMVVLFRNFSSRPPIALYASFFEIGVRWPRLVRMGSASRRREA